jgi:hypothetical protein
MFDALSYMIWVKPLLHNIFLVHHDMFKSLLGLGLKQMLSHA